MDEIKSSIQTSSPKGHECQTRISSNGISFDRISLKNIDDDKSVEIHLIGINLIVSELREMPMSSPRSQRSESRMSMSTPSFNSRGMNSGRGNKGWSGCLLVMTIFVVIAIIIGIIFLLKWIF
jgi:hypothetical protein